MGLSSKMGFLPKYRVVLQSGDVLQNGVVLPNGAVLLSGVVLWNKSVVFKWGGPPKWVVLHNRVVLQIGGCPLKKNIFRLSSLWCVIWSGKWFTLLNLGKNLYSVAAECLKRHTPIIYKSLGALNSCLCWFIHSIKTPSNIAVFTVTVTELQLVFIWILFLLYNSG